MAFFLVQRHFIHKNYSVICGVSYYIIFLLDSAIILFKHIKFRIIMSHALQRKIVDRSSHRKVIAIVSFYFRTDVLFSFL